MDLLKMKSSKIKYEYKMVFGVSWSLKVTIFL